MTETTTERVPPWTLGWRLQRALSWAGMSVEEMAKELEVSRSTVSGWLNDRHSPRAIYLRHWAQRCRVPLDWLVEGDDGLPRKDSNLQPAGYSMDHEIGSEDSSQRHIQSASNKARILAQSKRLNDLVPIVRPDLRGSR